MKKHSAGPWEDYVRTTLTPAFVDVLAPAGIVAKVWVSDEFQADHEEGLANLRLILGAPKLLAVVRAMLGWHFDWRCTKLFEDWCPEQCERSGNCPLLDARVLLKEIDGKEKPVAERKREFVWEDLVASNQYILWCDEEHEGRIRSLSGVARMAKRHVQPCYTIEFDPRYVMREVMDEIEAIITGATDAQEEP